MTLAAAATVLQGTLRGSNAEFSGVSTDTRTLAQGNLFVALVCPHFDGHGFVSEAAGKARSVRWCRARLNDIACCKSPIRLSLGTAAQWRRQFGSCHRGHRRNGDNGQAIAAILNGESGSCRRTT
jgi:UDP-N-acetylmuramoyl-tripeptide--D-alanyl-D-alanine ligase